MSSMPSKRPPRPTPAEPSAEQVEAVRRFSRFYTRQIGVLQEGLLESPFSLAQARVLYELAHRDGLTAAGLGRELGMDAGYLSRILQGFARRGLLARAPSTADGRQSVLSLTAKGRRAFAPLDRGSSAQVVAMLAALPRSDRERLVGAMRAVEQLLGGERSGKAAAFLLRQHRPGDMGWVIHRHGVLSAAEYGFDERFEALVATIAARFVERYDPARERCWIAEMDGEPVGSVFLVTASPTVAQLRLLLVEPKARGFGVGARLVDECVRFARSAGYRKITLWTNSVLVAARHIYAKAGFRLVHRERHRSFGQSLVGETWDLRL
jgi:DNA-binding MarR family transcriptional regulator/N-acetylglutamate synthase-like GNAT family acetyltransferase